MVMDYRVCNKIAIKDEHPMLRVQDLIQRLAKAHRYSKVDQRGYVHKSHRRTNEFMCRHGTELKLMLLGSARAPPRLQRLTQNVFIYELDD